jgi:tRNA-2-methylthio-N6-dimethylallyladenosine synthase
MASYFIWTVGCQMNIADSNYVARALEGLGHRPSANMEQADIIVLNSCSVRLSAEERITGKLGELVRLKRQRPDVTIALTGCMVTGQEESLHQRFPIIDHFFRPSAWEDFIGQLPEKYRAQTGATPRRFSSMISLTPVAAPHVEEYTMDLSGAGCAPLGDEEMSDEAVLLTDPRRNAAAISHSAQAIGIATSNRAESPFPRPLTGVAASEGHPLTAYVPVIYGCNKQCSYCIIPFRRGRERSRSVTDIVAEVSELTSVGIREVTLLGQNVDTYGHDLDPRSDLAALLTALNAIPDLWRIRFLTSHPKDMSQRLLDTVAALPKACEHINLPVQAGDDGVLRAMRRSYRTAYYKDLIGRIRATIPGVSLATDIIVGFPGETEEQFWNTYRMLEEIQFDAVHVAAYSPRPGTYAYTLPDDVSKAEKRARLQHIEKLQERVLTELNTQLLNQTVELFVEDREKGRWSGRTRANKIVFFDSERELRGQLVNVRINGVSPWSLQGEIVN